LHPNQENGLQNTMRSTKIPLIIKKLVISGLILVQAVFGFSNPIHNEHTTNDTIAHQATLGQVDSAHQEAGHLDEHHAAGPIDTKEEITAYIQHHLEDSHDFTLWTDGESGKHYGFPLFSMFFSDGFHAFSSAKWHHGEATVESDGKYFKLYHSKIYQTDASGLLTMDDKGHPTNKKAFDVSITKNVFGLLLASLILLLLFGGLAKSYKTSVLPTGVGRVLEPLVIFVRDEIAIPNIGETKYRKFMGYLLTVFFFIWVLNLMGMTPFGFGVTNNIAITTCFALFTYLIVTISANKEYWGHIFWMPGVPIPMKIVLAPIEVLGTLTKPFSLLIRLFANMTAGHFVVMSLIALMITLKAQFGAVASTGISFGLTLFISLIELLVAFLQAFIFTMLSSLFIGQATAEHEHHGAEHH
jgi:F-type H+-transporting ATPase subunit a